MLLYILNRYSFPTEIDLQTNVMYSSLTLLVLLAYYLFIDCFIVCTPVKWGLHKRTRGHNDYSDVSRDSMHVIHGKPRLHMDDVWILVYGVGFSYFVINYVCTCRQVMSLDFFTLGVYLLIGYELLASSFTMCTNANLVYLMAANLTFAGVIIEITLSGYVTLVNTIEQRDWFSVTFGMLLPFIGVLIMYCIKGNKKYNLGSIVEICEFGLPFSGIIALLIFVSMYQLYIHNKDVEFVHYLQTNFIATVLVSPIPLALVLLLLVEAVVNNHVLDVLISVSVASNIIQLAENEQSQSALISIILTFCAILLRLTIFTEFISKKPTGNASGDAATSMLHEMDTKVTHTITELDIEDI
jgi:hypothetical protein